MAGWFKGLLGKRAAPEADVPLLPDGPAAAYEAGQDEQARSQAQARLAAAPQDGEAQLVLAQLALEAGEVRPALTALQALLEREPGNVGAWVAFARAQVAAKRPDAALDALARARSMQLGPSGVEAEHALLLLAEGKTDQAAQQLLAALGSGRRIAQARFELGNALLRAGRQDDALEALSRAVAAWPQHAHASANLGALLRDKGRFDDAERHLRQALALAPWIAEAQYNLAMLHIQRHRWTEASALLRDYVAAQPKDADGLYWYANTLMGLGDAAGARAQYQATLRLEANHAQTRWGLVMAQLPAIPADEAEQARAPADFARELDTTKDWFRTHHAADGWRAVGAQQPFYLAYIPGNHQPVMAAYGALCASLMGAWARKIGVPAPAPAGDAPRLKVGIVSAHIQDHSVWHAVLRGWVEHLDPQRFDLHLFHTGPLRDAQTDWAAKRCKLRQHLGEWTTWAKAISEAKLDVLVYPEIGMDATSARLSSLRLARVQLASWGHPLTTGLPTIDGYLSAEAFEPAGAATHYTEPLFALPRLGCAYQPYGLKPVSFDLRPWGIAPADRFLLCPGVAFKYAPADDALLVAIARRCAPVKLLFFRAEIDHTATLLEQRLRKAFAGAALDFDAHVRFIPWQPQEQFFGLLQRADACLDSVGFSGFNTAMQAIECGTPLVAWEGGEMRGRFASGILRQMDLGEWIATTHDAYVDRVARLCSDAAARKQLREQIALRRDALYGDKASVDALADKLQALAAAAPTSRKSSPDS